LAVTGAFGLTVPRALDFGERAFVVVSFVLYLAANLHTKNVFNAVVALGDLLTVAFVLLRRPTNNISLSLSDWTLALVGTAGVMFARPYVHPLAGVVAPMMLWMTGLALSLAAKASLNVRFGIAPANRGVQARGAYAFIRHPMYAGYVLMGVSYFLMNPSAWNAAVYGIAWSAQFARVLREERWLGRDPAYRAYAEAVRFRFIPFVV
jgi:protein-S-isoprenylcysteine O-methyltransferase Ste14